MVQAHELVRSGYFPGELPPPFSTDALSDLVKNARPTFPAGFDDLKKSTWLCTHNLARVGGLRRRLGIPNPVTFVSLAEGLEANWATLATHVAKSPISLTTPVTPDPSGRRAIGRKCDLTSLPEERARLRATQRFLLVTDIALCYPSIYTHSIAWALHGKPIAKASTGFALLGDQIDRLVRRCQERQTLGIPIGPDYSLAVAEIVLTSIDHELVSKLGHQPAGFRYMDDYELGFDTRAGAEAALGALQSAVGEFGLQLNSIKTRIIETPVPVELTWASEIRCFAFREGQRNQHYDLIRYFGRVFELSKKHPSDPVLSYAVARLLGVEIDLANWKLCESLLLQCVVAEPGVLRWFIDHLITARVRGAVLNGDLISNALERVICEHAPLGHGSEVAWSIWAALVLNLRISDSTAISRISSIEDAVVAVLALHAESEGLFASGLTSTLWKSLMTTQELGQSNWLLSYEAAVQGWLPSATAGDHIAGDAEFAFLRTSGVRFYDVTKKATYVPLRFALGGGGGGNYAF